MGRRADQIDEETLKVMAGIEEAQDLRKSWAALKARMTALRESGRPVPEALIAAERQVMRECMAQSQGR